MVCADSIDAYVKYPDINEDVVSIDDVDENLAPQRRYTRRAPFLAGAAVGAVVANHHHPNYYAPSYYYPTYPSSGYYYNNNGYYYSG